MIAKQFKLVRETFSGQAAKGDVAAVVRHHRIQASPGYRAAAHYVLNQLLEAGIEASLETCPADYNSEFWAHNSFQEWEARSGTLHLISPESRAIKLADYREMKLSLIQRSQPFQGEAELVLLEDGLVEADYDGLDVSGKMVLTKGAVSQVHQLAVEKYGAVGIIFDGMSNAPPVREPMDLPDARQYTSFWWSGHPGEKQCFGFVLSPRQGAKLRQLIAQRARQGEPPVTLRASIDTRFYAGEIELVTALIPGQEKREECALIVSHLCHPQPSANDNATGVAANLEAARTLHSLITAGKLPAPRRSIRFLWMPEMTGSYAYLSRHEKEIPGMIAGVNLDMVGEDQTQTGSVLLLERPPEAAASFAPDLLERLRDELPGDAPTLTGMGSYSLYRYATTQFSGGSDHYIFSDPTVGVPMPMLIQWPDKFYHTSADTLDKVSPDSLARSGCLAAAYAYFIAAAGEKETRWLAGEMAARFQIELTRMTQKRISKTAGAVDTVQPSFATQTNYALSRFQAALHSLARLWPGIETENTLLLQEASLLAELAEKRFMRAAPQPIASAPGESRDLDQWEHKASTIIAQRRYRGPGLSAGRVALLPLAERLEWQEFLRRQAPGAFTILSLAEYWADGSRTLLEIIDLVELESGVRAAELVVRIFELMAQLELVVLRPAG